jgi:hypothetical protein
MSRSTLLGLVIAIAACQQGTSGPGGSTTDAGNVYRTCSQDTDCATGTICQICNNTCVYPPQQHCSLDMPCPCGWSCRSSVCLSNLGAQAPSCVYNKDCPVDQYCNRALYVCEYPMYATGPGTTKCTTNADCGIDQVCSTAQTPATCADNQTHDCFTKADCQSYEQCAPNHQCEHQTC